MVRARLLIFTGTLLATAVGAACGEDAPGVQETLPPLNTTTSTTTTILVTTTVQRFYVIQRGDTLSKIADRFNVRLEDLMVLNGIENADKIEAGQELEIPTGAVVLDTLPPAQSSSSSSTG